MASGVSKLEGRSDVTVRPLRGMTKLKRMLAALALSFALFSVVSVGAAPHFDARILLASPSYIGVGVMNVSDETARRIGLVDPHGIEISSVAEDSPGEEAGLQRGDIVLTYRGGRVHGYEHFARLVKETPPGRAVELGIVRGGERQTIEVEIGRRDAIESVRQTLDAVKQHIDAVKSGHAAFAFDLSVPRVRMNVRNRRIGIEMEKLDGQLAEYFGVQRGLLVRAVSEASPAEIAGIRAGDVIVSVDGEQVIEADDFRRALASVHSQPVTLGIFRDRERTSVRLDPRANRETVPARPLSFTN